MDSPVIQRRQSYSQQNEILIPENSKNTVIHFTIIFSVLVSVFVIGLLLCAYRRRLQKSFSKNLNRIVNITHLSNNDDEIYSSLDYYSNNYNDYNKKVKSQPRSQPQTQPQTQPQSQPQTQPQLELVHENEHETEIQIANSPNSSILRGNRNYFIYAKSADPDNLQTNKRDTSNMKLGKRVISKNNNSEPNKPNNNFINNFMSNIRTKESKLNVNQISSPVSPPSDSIYDNQKADSISTTTKRIIPPIPTFSPNNYVQPPTFSPNNYVQPPTFSPNNYVQPPTFSPNNYVQPPTFSPNNYVQPPTFSPYNYVQPMRGPQMTSENDFSVPNTLDAAITTSDNPIIEDFNEDNFNKIIINKTTEEVILSMVPINGNDDQSNFNNSIISSYVTSI
jgi:hypothetical protein